MSVRVPGGYNPAAIAVTGGTATGLTSLALASGNVTSGRYTPTLTNTTNVAASTAFATNYLQVGDEVTVSGVVNIQCTANSVATAIGISLPVASNLAAAGDLGGVGAMASIAGFVAAVSPDTTNHRATLSFVNGTDTTNRSWYFHFTYRVIWINRTASLFGDSLTAGIFADVRSRSNYSLFSGGNSGDTSTQIATRFLAATDAQRGQKTVIWAGRNNYTDPTTVKADIASMVAAFKGADYRVLAVLNETGEGVGTNAYNTIIQLNTDLQAIYGARYFDIRAYFVSLYDPNQAQDVIDHANDVPPSSLIAIPPHPNAAGYALLAPKLISVAGLVAATDGP